MERTSSHYSAILHFAATPTLPEHPSAPIRMMVLTSIRDVGSCDRNGTTVRMPEGWRHMEGAVERLIYETRDGGALHGILEIAGIISDDVERDMEQSAYPIQPHPDHPWIHPLHLRNDEGDLYRGEKLTHYVPSDFRLVNGKREPEEKAQRKILFERRIGELMRERNADILLSDHYMAKIEHLIAAEHGLYGRVLNIHPAITIKDHLFCFRGPTPTQDAIDRAIAEQGSSSNGHPRVITGATLHFVNAEIDDGPPIAHMEGTPVYPYDHPQHLRYRNYQQAKLPLMIMGLRHYIENIYPHLDRHTSQLPISSHAAV